MGERCEWCGTEIPSNGDHDSYDCGVVLRDQRSAAQAEVTRLTAALAAERERAEKAITTRDEALDGRKKVSPWDLLNKSGGEWLGVARSWIQRRARNGEHVTWGSSDALEAVFTVSAIEELAADVAAVAMRPQPTEEHVSRLLRARWMAEHDRDEWKRRAESAERTTPQPADTDSIRLRNLLSRILGDDGPDLDAYLDGHVEAPSVPRLIQERNALDRDREEWRTLYERASDTINAARVLAEMLRVFSVDAPGKDARAEDRKAWDALTGLWGALEQLDAQDTTPPAPGPWEDRPDEWSRDVDAAFPTRSGSHRQYGIAMRMIGSRHSKGSLVALVNWLLFKRPVL